MDGDGSSAGIADEVERAAQGLKVAAFAQIAGETLGAAAFLDDGEQPQQTAVEVVRAARVDGERVRFRGDVVAQFMIVADGADILYQAAAVHIRRGGNVIRRVQPADAPVATQAEGHGEKGIFCAVARHIQRDAAAQGHIVAFQGHHAVVQPIAIPCGAVVAQGEIAAKTGSSAFSQSE